MKTKEASANLFFRPRSHHIIVNRFMMFDIEGISRRSVDGVLYENEEKASAGIQSLAKSIVDRRKRDHGVETTLEEQLDRFRAPKLEIGTLYRPNSFDIWARRTHGKDDGTAPDHQHQ